MHHAGAVLGSLALLLAPGLAFVPDRGQAQDLEPWEFSPAPIGMNFALVAHGYGTGLADPVANLAVNFIGAPALTLKEMATCQECTVVRDRLPLISWTAGRTNGDRRQRRGFC